MTSIVALAATIVWSPAAAASTCSYDDVSTATLVVGADEFPVVFADAAGNILVIDDETAVPCDGATTANTTSFVISGVSGETSYEGVVIEQSPGAFSVTTTVTDMDEVDLSGTAGDDTIRAGESGSNVVVDLDNDDNVDVTAERAELQHLAVLGDDGNDTITFAGSTGGFTASAVTALDNGTTLRGEDGDDNLVGSDGRDAIFAEGGEDTIDGRDGNDEIDVGGTDANIVDGGAGTDQVEKTFILGNGVVVSNNSIVTTTPGGTLIDSLASIETARITFSSQTTGIDVDASAFAGPATIFGSDGDDTMIASQGGGNYLGFDGDDNFVAGPGNDGFQGSGGLDTVSYQTASAGVSVIAQPDGGTPQPTGGSGTDLVEVENVIGSPHDDTLHGDHNPNVLDGGGGGDSLFASGGNDTLIDAEGDDTLDGGVDIDALSYANAAGGVTVDLRITAAQNTIGAGSDTITAVERLTGTASKDLLIGTAAKNVLIGGAGGDKIKGLGQADKLVGGRGRDTLNGGSGNDTCKSGEVLISC